MWKRQRTGSALCYSCGKLVGVREKRCLNCGRGNPALWGLAPAFRNLGHDLGFVPLVIWGCSLLYLGTLVIDPGGIRMQGLFSLLSPSLKSLFLFGASGAVPVFEYGRWWSVLSAAWLHGGLLHILFNLLWVRQLGPATAELYGPSRMVILYTFSSITGFLLSTLAGGYLGFLPIPFLRGASFTVGASASIFGLLGALVFYGRNVGSSMIGRQAMQYAVVLGVFGFIMQGVDNYAHLGGFLGGYAASAWLDPRRPERFEHLIAALVCIAMTGLAILASIVHGLSLFR